MKYYTPFAIIFSAFSLLFFSAACGNNDKKSNSDTTATSSRNDLTSEPDDLKNIEKLVSSATNNRDQQIEYVPHGTPNNNLTTFDNYNFFVKQFACDISAKMKIEMFVKSNYTIKFTRGNMISLSEWEKWDKPCAVIKRSSVTINELCNDAKRIIQTSDIYTTHMKQRANELVVPSYSHPNWELKNSYELVIYNIDYIINPIISIYEKRMDCRRSQ